MKPLIGLSSFVDPQPRADYIALSAHYPRSVREAGGIPLNIPVCTNLNIAVETVARIDGLLLSGGKDLAPWRYGEEPIREIGAFDSIRDEWELALFRAAGERGIPVLGICRGHQLINVAMGGTLYQDLWAQRKDCLGHAPQDFPVEELYHSVEITDHDSLLASVLGMDSIRVNSFHHQAVKLLAPGPTCPAIKKKPLRLEWA
ncbi:MAG: gamma-glutamyl-gamma-aminobutyrate hydrolase family protein [Rectinemataceae bacterium]